MGAASVRLENVFEPDMVALNTSVPVNETLLYVLPEPPKFTLFADKLIVDVPALIIDDADVVNPLPVDKVTVEPLSVRVHEAATLKAVAVMA